MIKHKHILKNFSDQPITKETIEKNGFDTGSKEFINSFLWLEAEGFIRPLNQKYYNNCGLNVDFRGDATWTPIDIVITQEGKKYLHPIKAMLLEPLIVGAFRHILIAVIAFIIGVYSPYIRELLPKPQTNIQEEKKPDTQKTKKEPSTNNASQ